MIHLQAELPVLVSLVRRWRLFLLVALPLALAIGLYGALVPAQYEAKTTVAFAPREPGQVGADVLKVLLPRYVAYLSAPATTQQVAVAAQLPERILTDAEVAVDIDTANLSISVRDTDPARAAAAANALSTAAVDSANRQDELLRADLVAVALPPDEPATPSPILFALAGLVAGALAGALAVALADRARPQVRGDRDVPASLGLPPVGQVPSSPDLTRSLTNAASDPALGASMGAVLGKFERLLRQSPRTEGELDHLRVTALTAPSSGHGTTSLALAYAAAAARRGRRVALVDADVLHAGLSDRLAASEGRAWDASTDTEVPGLLDVLAGRTGVEDCLRRGFAEGLSVLPTAIQPQAVELLSKNLSGVIESLLQVADQVVLDCPSLDFDEGQIAVAASPSVLVVVRAGTPRAELAEGAARLDGLGTPYRGLILNRGGRGALGDGGQA